jgi:hypothetical protein
LGQEYRTLADKKIKAITQAYTYLKNHTWAIKKFKTL